MMKRKYYDELEDEFDEDDSVHTIDDELSIHSEQSAEETQQNEVIEILDDDEEIIEIPKTTIKTKVGYTDTYKFLKSVKTCDTELASVIEIDNRTFATAGKAGIIEFWDLYSFGYLKKLERDDDCPKISCMELLHDGSILTVGKDYLNIWKQDKLVLSFQPHIYWTRCCAITNGNYLLTAGRDSDGIKKWSIDELLAGETDHYEVVNFSHSWIFTMVNIDDKFFGHGGNDKFYIRTFDKMKKIKEFGIEFQGDAMRSIYDSRYHYLYIGSYGGDFIVVNCEDWKIIHKSTFGSPVGGLLILKDGHIAVGLYNQTIVILDSENSFRVLCELTTNQTHGEIYWLANLGDKYFCSIDGGGYFQMWEINFKSKKLILMLKEKRDTNINFKFR